MSRHPNTWPRITTWPDILLINSDVEIIYKTDTKLVAEVQGRTGIRRRIEHDSIDWRCSCPSWLYRRACVHQAAVARIAAPPKMRNLQPVPDPQLTLAGTEKGAA